MSYPPDWRTLPPEACTVEVPKRSLEESAAIACALRNTGRAKDDVTEIAGVEFVLARAALWCAQKLLSSGAASYSRRLERKQPEGLIMTRLFAFFLFLLLPFAALAQASLPTGELPTDLAFDEALKQLVPLIGSFKGASALGIVVAVTQLLLVLARSPISNLAGKWKLLIVACVSLVSTYVALVAAGASWSAALFMGPVMTALQVLGHQVYTQVKPQEPAA